jgi:hypothetical protein
MAIGPELALFSAAPIGFEGIFCIFLEHFCMSTYHGAFSSSAISVLRITAF